MTGKSFGDLDLDFGYMGDLCPAVNGSLKLSVTISWAIGV